MVSGTAVAVTVLLAIAGPGDQPGSAPLSAPAESARSSLAKGNYPWYDASTDSAKPLVSTTDFDPKLSNASGLGEALGFALAACALGILVFLIVTLWMRYRASPDTASEIVVGASGSTQRLEALPSGLRPETDDPWAEAVRLRARGDYAGAVIRLFAHQLLALDRLRQIRLGPGRTGRQLVRAVDDPQFHAGIEPTLRMFEAVYYGQVVPTAEAFERVWKLAEEFEKLVAMRTNS